MGGVKELGRPFNVYAAKFSKRLAHLKTRELRARCVKISRATRDGENLSIVFIGISSEKTVGIGGARGLLESVLIASVLSVKPANCQLNEKNQKP